MTIVVPAYNYARYVAEAIDSLLAQTLQSLEIIVIDDASTDNTPEVLAAYAGHPRVQIVRHETNMGHIATFNEGISMARGEFLGLLSADDYCLATDALERQVRLLRSHPRAGVVYSGHALVRDGSVMRVVLPERGDEVRDGISEFRRLIWGNEIPHSGTLIRLDVQRELGPYTPRLPHTGDWDLWLRAAARWDIGCIAAPLYAYRMHDANMHHSTMSPSFQAEQGLATLARAFEALPADAPADLRRSRAAAERHVLFQAPWFDVFNGRRQRAWRGMTYAAFRRPSVLMSWEMWSLMTRLVVMTAIGGAGYRRLAGAVQLRGRRASTAGRQARDESSTP